MGITQHADFVPVREPMRRTVLRTVSIAMTVALVICLATHNGSAFAPFFFGGLWLSLGGHVAEVVWLNGIRHRLPRSPLVQKPGRIMFWFVSGIVLGAPMGLTMRLLDPKFNPPPLLSIGVAFVLIELVIHYVVLHLSRRPSFYNSAG